MKLHRLSLRDCAVPGAPRRHPPPFGKMLAGYFCLLWACSSCSYLERYEREFDKDEVRAPLSEPNAAPREMPKNVTNTPRIPAAPIAWAAHPEPATVLTRVAFGSCASQYQRQDIWPIIASAEPDLFFHLGDMIYADILPDGAAIPSDLDVVAKAQVDYALLSSQRTFRDFANRIPMMLVWDDHDYGRNDAGADFERRTEMEELFLEFVGASPEDERRTRPGVYTSRVFGPPGRRVQVLLLDTRSFRSRLLRDNRPKEEKRRAMVVGQYVPNADPKATLLGTSQWQWLEHRLKEPAEARLIISSIQVVASEKGIESWGNFPLERDRLYSLIASTRAHGVVLLSGDVHFAELSRTLDGPYPLYDATSSNLAQKTSNWGEPFVNSFRVRGPLFDQNFGVIDFDWESAQPSLTLRMFDGRGKEAFSEQVKLSDLQTSQTPTSKERVDQAR